MTAACTKHAEPFVMQRASLSPWQRAYREDMQGKHAALMSCNAALDGQSAEHHQVCDPSESMERSRPFELCRSPFSNSILILFRGGYGGQFSTTEGM